MAGFQNEGRTGHEMPDELQAIAQYKVRAEEVRRKARSMRDPEMRATLQEIATDYELIIPGTLRAIHRSKQTLKRFETSELDPT